MPTRGHEANATLMPSASSRAPGSASSGPAGTPAPLTTHPCTTPANAFQREELTQGTEARRALAATRAGAAAVSEVQGLQRGTVTLGVMQQIGVVGLPSLLATYHRR